MNNGKITVAGIRPGSREEQAVSLTTLAEFDPEQDGRTVQLATEKGIARTQAGIRLAVQEHPDALYVFGNAPTALMELCDLIRKGKNLSRRHYCRSCRFCTRTGIQTHGKTICLYS